MLLDKKKTTIYIYIKQKKKPLDCKSTSGLWWVFLNVIKHYIPTVMLWAFKYECVTL